MTQFIITTPQELEQLLARILKSHLNNGVSPPESSEKQILNLEEASRFLGIPKNTLYGYTSRRQIPHHKVGRSLKFYKSDLIEWLNEYKQKTQSEILINQL